MDLLKALPLLLLAGCGVAEFKEDGPPPAPFPRFGSVEVRVAPVELDVPPEVRPELEGFAASLPARIGERLRKRNLLADGGRALVVDLRIVSYDPGSQTARYLVGFGAGGASIEARTEFRDGETRLGSGVARGTVWGGLFGGSVSTAHDNVARAVVDYVERASGAR